MKKKFAIIGFLAIILLVATVFAQTISLDKDVEEFVKDVAQSKGIDKSKIKEVKEVNFNELPKEVKLENIDETNLAMYQVNIDSDEKPIYVITASETKLKQVIQKFTRKMLINFGYAGEITNSGFLMSAVGVVGTRDKGYVMIRSGSITGISTNLESTSNEGTAEIIIYKNGEEMGFRNTIVILDKNIYSDYDTISENTLNFEKGDVISLYLKLENDAIVKDVNTLLEISTE